LVVIKGFLFLKKRRRPPCGKQKTLFAVVDFRTARAKKAKVFWFFFSKKNILSFSGIGWLAERPRPRSTHRRRDGRTHVLAEGVSLFRPTALGS
jgi:hypothetical protein